MSKKKTAGKELRKNHAEPARGGEPVFSPRGGREVWKTGNYGRLSNWIRKNSCRPGVMGIVRQVER